MNHTKTPEIVARLRPLHTDFTTKTLRHALTAKQRITTKQQIKAFFKEPFSMKSLTFLRTAPGAVLAVAIIATTGVSAYALTNWFNADVTVTQQDSVLSVDLSQCQGNLPPGIEPTTDRHHVQFKITGNPHISAHDLQQNLLGACESSSVIEFYATLFPNAGLSSTGQPSPGINHEAKYAIRPGMVEAISEDTVTIRATGAKSDSFQTRAFKLATDSSVYDAGKQSSLGALKVGDVIMFLAYAPDVPDSTTEGVSVLDDASLHILSIFKTQYNDGIDSSFNYQPNGIMPLDSHNQIHQ